MNSLQKAIVDAVLAACLPQGVKDAIDSALSQGVSKREILRRLRREYGRRPTILAVEAYLGADQRGNVR